MRFAPYVPFCDVFRAHVDYDTFCYDMCALCVLRYVKLRFIAHVESTCLPRFVKYVLLRTFRCVIYVFRAHVNYDTLCYDMCVLCVLRYVKLRFIANCGHFVP